MVEGKLRGRTSEVLHERAKVIMPGGVSSPVRLFPPHPFFARRAEGCVIVDADGNEYTDYCMAYGPLIFGHAYGPIINAVRGQLRDGTLYGTPTEGEVAFAESIKKAMPACEMLRLVNSGTEATMHAIRLARGFTGRKTIVKFDGCYHGAHDSVLVKAGSGAATHGGPSSLGIPEEVVENTLVLPYNDPGALEKAFQEHGRDIAAVIIEPVIGNIGVVEPAPGYLESVRRVTEENGALLILDEVITGFRLAFGGAQEMFGIRPDLVTLGKVIGGGFPLAAYGGRKDIMSMVSPLGAVYQAGTFAGNPVSVAAGRATLDELSARRNSVYPTLERSRERLTNGIRDAARDSHKQVQVNETASMFQMFFTGQPVTDATSASSCDRGLYMRLHHGLLERGVFFPPSQFETCFLSTAHTHDRIDATVEAVAEVLRGL